MTNEFSPGEIQRRLMYIEDAMRSRVSKDLYDRDLREIHEDIAEMRKSISKIEDSFSWAVRLFIAQFLAVIIGLLFFLLGQP